MADPWFHHHPLPDPPATIELAAEEARHVAGARRLETGARIVLFDGEGGVAAAEIVEAGRRCVTVRTLGLERAPAATPALWLASALPKGDRQSTLLSMATQLGLAAFTPLRCAEAVARPGKGSTDRWTRIAREACKQSRRAHLPLIRPECAPAAYAHAAAERGEPVLVLQPGGEPVAELVRSGALRREAVVHLVVGPEAGFADAELAGLRAAGARLLDLGDGILRIETACVAGLALLGTARS